MWLIPFNIGESSDENELCRLLQLVLGCAVHCERQEEFIQVWRLQSKLFQNHLKFKFKVSTLFDCIGYTSNGSRCPARHNDCHSRTAGDWGTCWRISCPQFRFLCCHDWSKSKPDNKWTWISKSSVTAWSSEWGTQATGQRTPETEPTSLCKNFLLTLFNFS